MEKVRICTGDLIHLTRKEKLGIELSHGELR